MYLASCWCIELIIQFQSLPVAVKRRVKALKKIQLQYTDLEADFYKEVHALEVSSTGGHIICGIF